MLTDKLATYTLILASGSPRRHKFLRDMGLDFKIETHPVEEIYPKNLKLEAITNYLAKLKASPFKEKLVPKQIVVTSDTIVWHNKQSLGKPVDKNEAIKMLQTLSNDWHKVITSICFTTLQKQKVVHCVTKVRFKKLTDEEIRYYVENYNPLDKAGAYGIQEWIGAIGITKIKGPYNNVVGLPTHLFYKTLLDIVS
ncbi:septum formation protein [Saonia flava]|uniref:dTTP/UTP pyrophosphatase n=1 Tax=Saonia flava TaxID=523696 RepID=A0A846QV42_9FLAO|nr:Maf family nucleotide pyrophosphatase [Saonia flava]NJB70163.1 septum formation protein [Saonia flava]